MSMERAPEELDFMQFGTLKMIFMEQVLYLKSPPHCIHYPSVTATLPLYLLLPSSRCPFLCHRSPQNINLAAV
jgi:hypothetical protein